MKLIIYYLSVFLLAVMMFAVWSAPSYLLKPYIPKQLTIDQLTGQIIKGQAKKINILAGIIPELKQNLSWQQLDWALHILPLLWLEPQASIKADGKLGQLSTHITYRLLDKEVQASQISGQLDIVKLSTLLGYELPIIGKLNIQSGQFNYQLNQLKALSGKIILDKLVILEQLIGRIIIEVNFNPKKENIQFQLNSHKSNANISISGVVVLGLDGGYQVNVRLGTTKQTPPSLKDALSLLGTESGADRVVKLTGKL